MNYLTETYGGDLENPNLTECYYCYTIYDKERNMYYSGVKLRRNASDHGLLKEYFTSSTVNDFKFRLKQFPETFEYIVEYFKDADSAIKAEINYHHKHNVSKNPLFYNVSNAGGTKFGVGSVLCKSISGKTYRVSSEEYLKGNHISVSKDTMNAIEANTGKLVKIPVNKYDGVTYISELEGKVHVYDTILDKNVRITKCEYDQDTDNRYIGITKNKVYVYNDTNELICITPDEYAKNKDKYRHYNKNMVVVKTLTGDNAFISKEEFLTNKHLYNHPNAGFIIVLDKITNCTIRISKSEYDNNKERYQYCNPAKQYYKCYDNKFNTYVTISYNEFVNNRDRYSGYTIGKTTVLDLLENKLKCIPVENKHDYPWYVSSNVKVIYYYNNMIFTTGMFLIDYLKCYGIKGLKIKNGTLETWLINNGGKVIYKGINGFGNFKQEDFYENKKD